MMMWSPDFDDFEVLKEKGAKRRLLIAEKKAWMATLIKLWSMA